MDLFGLQNILQRNGLPALESIVMLGGLQFLCGSVCGDLSILFCHTLLLDGLVQEVDLAYCLFFIDLSLCFCFVETKYEIYGTVMLCT